MARFCTVFLLLLCSNALIAQNTTTYSIFFRWKTGDTIPYAGTKVYKRFDEKGQITDSLSQTFTTTLLVLDSTGSTYKIRVEPTLDWMHWTMMEYRPLKDKNELLAQLSGPEFQYLEYWVDQHGSFFKMYPLDAFSEHALQIFHQYTETHLIPKRDIKAAKKVQTRLLSPARLQHHIMEELMLMHHFYGKTFTLDSLCLFDDQIPNIYNLDVSLTQHNRFIASIPAEGWDGLISIRDFIVMDGEDALTYLSESVLGDVDENWKTQIRQNPVRYEDFVELFVYPQNGLVYSMEYSRSTYFGNHLT